MTGPLRRRILGLAAAMACLAVTPSTAPSAGSARGNEDPFQATVKPFLSKHCTLCHNAELKTGDLLLDAYADERQALEHPGVWREVLRRLKSGAMPPEGRPRPSADDIEAVARWIETRLERMPARPPDPGRVTARRLNRAEYNNTVRDLLGVDFRPADDFPTDDSGYGFDNIGDVLSLPPVLMEKYLAAADKIARRVVVAPAAVKPTLEKYLAPRAEEEIKSAGGHDIAYSPEGALLTKHKFPADGEYVLEVRVVDRRLRPPKEGDPAPEPPDPAKLAIFLDDRRLDVFDVEAGEYKKRAFDVRVEITAGEHTIEAKFLSDGIKPEPAKPKDPDARDPYDGERKLFVDHLQIEGPFDPKFPPLTESHKRVFVCGHPIGKHEPGCGQMILGRLARGAYRRPVRQEEIDALQRFVDLARRQGDSFERGIQVALKAILVSPHFLFRIEEDPDPANPQAIHPVNPYELATRLSYFLWSSMPDEELFQRAVNAELARPDVLASEVRRMLSDPKSAALVENFGGQWLHLRNLESVTPDADLFPRFDEELRAAMKRETELFFEAIIREDRSILDFLDAPFTFLNERLARHYGIEGVEGDEFRRVSLDGEQRSGILTHASVLTVSSYPTRTSPVLRGKWLLENILGAPPPPPPPGVPELNEQQVGLTGTLREQLEQHRANPGCAVCHVKMDALGFGLENYDPVGAWRTHDGKFPLDTSGTLPGGKSFTRPSELKAILKAERDDFARCITEKMLTYAIGRGLERYDGAAVDQIVRRLAENDYRFSELVLGIVNSRPFRMRRGEGGER